MSNSDDDIIVKMLATDTLKEVNIFVMREQGMKYDIRY
jgi:hypothetical protein